MDIKLWDIKSEKCIQHFIGHDDLVTSIKNVNDDKLISGDESGVIKIWKIETGQCLETINNAHTSEILEC